MTGLQGRAFGGYQLLEPLGAGGVAEAYRAKPVQGSGREVVVKIIQPNLAQQPAIQTRIQLAMQKAAALANHAHVLPVLASGEEGGYFYIVTPYVTEGTLRDWIGRGWRLGVNDVGPFFRQLATGLAHAHSLGIAHENLKPVNIYLFEGRHVLVGDFGVLWDVAQIDPQSSGPAAEAVEFLAPEAFNKVFAPAADIYSLGAVLFATLTGRPPFRGPTPGAVYSAHLNQPVPPLASAAPSLDRHLQSLDLVIQRAMAKRPEERYATPLLFADAVESTLAQAQKGRLGKSRRPSVWSLGNDNPLTFNEFGMPVLAGQASSTPQMGGASPGGLQALNFRRPTKVEGLDGLMEDGYIGSGWNDGGAQGGLSIPAPVGPPVPQVAAPPLVAPPMAPMAAPAPPRQDVAPNYPPGYGPGYGPGYAQGYGQGYQAPGMAGPGMAGPGMAAPGIGGPGMGVAPLTIPPPTPEPPAPASRASARPDPGLPGMEPAPDLASPSSEGRRSDRNFSATELGLPRLTTADLGKGLAADVAQQLDSSARSGGLDYDESQTYTATRGGARIQYRGETSESAAWSAAYPTGEWGYSEEQSAYYTSAQPRRGSGRSGDRWDAMESVEAPARGGRSRGRRGSRDDYRDDYYEDERAYNGRRPTRRPQRERRSFAGWLRGLLFGVLPLLVLGLALLVIAKPGLCPGGACDSLSSAARKAIPALNQFGGASAASVSMSASPAALQVTTPAGAEKGVTFSLVSAGANNVPWSATVTPNWLTVSPASGVLATGSATPITVTAKPTGINPGQYTGAVTVAAGGGSLRVPVTITIAIGPQISVTPATLSFTTCGSQQTITVKNTGDSALNVTVAPASNSTSALTLSPTSLTLDSNASDTIKVSVKCSAAVSANYGVQFGGNGGTAQVAVKYS